MFPRASKKFETPVRPCGQARACDRLSLDVGRLEVELADLGNYEAPQERLVSGKKACQVKSIGFFGAPHDAVIAVMTSPPWLRRFFDGSCG
jgi:hypothetical protein